MLLSFFEMAYETIPIFVNYFAFSFWLFPNKITDKFHISFSQQHTLAMPVALNKLPLVYYLILPCVFSLPARLTRFVFTLVDVAVWKGLFTVAML